MNSGVSIGAIVVTHNRAEKLKITLQRYLESAIQKIVVVDNASMDVTPAYLAELEAIEPDRVVVLGLAKNCGGAGGFYHGLEYAKNNLNCDWLVLSDDDSYPAKNAIASFQKSDAARSTDTNIVAAQVLFPNGDLCAMNKPMEYPDTFSVLKNLFSGRSLLAVPDSSWGGESPRSVMASSFVGMFVSLSSLRASGVMPDKNYFLYWDDISFCMDMRNAGFNIVYYPDLIFYHDCPRRSGKITGTRFYYFVRNGFRTIGRMPVSLRYPAFFLKGLVWLWQSLRQGSIRYYFRALRDI